MQFGNFYLICIGIGDAGSFVILSSFITVRQNGAFKEGYRGKTVSRKDATAQRKTFLHFDLILIMGDVRAERAQLDFEF